MTSDIVTKRLGDVIELVIDNRGRNPKKYEEAGIPVIDNYLITSDGRVSLTEVKRYINTETYDSFLRKYIQEGDVLMTLVGNGYGKVATTPKEKCAIIQNTIGIRCDESNDNQYLYYLLKVNRNALINLNRGAAQPSIKVGDVLDLEFKFPPLNMQKKVASILKSIDDKIELNRQTNQTLEHIAQALFKCWFVDFEPTRAKIIAKAQGADPATQELAAQAIICGAMTLKQLEAITQNLEPTLQQAINEKLNQANQTPINAEQLKTIAALFPNALVDSELGEIPEGWGCKALSEWGAIICGKTPSKKKDEYYGGDIPFIKIPDMHGNMYVIESVDTLTEEGAETQRKKILPEGSICVSCIATVGQVVITCEESFTNQQINSIIPIERFYTPYLYFSMLEQNKNIHDLASGGSATLNLNTGNFSKIEIVRPHSELLKKFSVLVESMLKNIITNQLQQKELTSIRDTLLPKLLSGELDVSSD